MQAVKKSFDGIEVLKGVDFTVRAGEVHALVGENGAGKTTMMNLLAGVHQPTSGTIHFAGQDNLQIPDEKTAQELGISIVFQERSLFAQLSLADNIFAARQPARFGHINRKKLSDQYAHLAAASRPGIGAKPVSRGVIARTTATRRNCQSFIVKCEVDDL